MKCYKKRNLFLLLFGGAALLGLNTSHAFSSRATTVTTYCTSNGYSLLPEYQADTCDAACHNNTAGVTAFESGNYDYFCEIPVATCTDADNDGYFAEGGDCGTAADFNDNSAEAYPGAAEVCTDGIDNDGNGLVDAGDPNAIGCAGGCTDGDGDGYSLEGGSCGPVDCDDANSSVNPGAVEACGDGIDNNCNGFIDTADKNAVACPVNCTDQDGDGFSADGGACGPIDCNDNDASTNPGALEICGDGVDNNCNGQVDGADGVCQDPNAGNQTWWRSGNSGDCAVDNGGGNGNTGGDSGGNGNTGGDSGGNTGGGTPGDSGNFSHPFGWNNPTSQHPDYVDENGVADCVSCHSIDQADTGSATSCFNCHGQEWDDPAGGGDSGDSSDDENDDESDDESDDENSSDERSDRERDRPRGRNRSRDD